MIFEKIKNSLQKAESVKCYGSLNSGNLMIPLADAISIVEQAEAEYNNGWIPCSERLPEDMQRCLVTARIYFTPDHVDEPDNYIGIKLNTYSIIFGWLGGDEVFAWMPLPEPYAKGE